MQRCRLPELMDQPHLDPQQRARALLALNRINRTLGVVRQQYHNVCRMTGGRPASILDLGVGGGGFLGYVSQRHNGAGIAPLLGLDLSADALRQARRWQDNGIHWVRADALNVPLADDSIDVVTCSLFLHHLQDDQVIAVLREAARVARRGLVVNDLTRSRIALLLTWLFTRLFTRSVVVHYDGPLSVRAAYTRKELAVLARRAGLNGAAIRRGIPFRMTLTWQKTTTP